MEVSVKIVDHVRNQQAKRALLSPKRPITLDALRKLYRVDHHVREQLKLIAQLAIRTGILVIETAKADRETAEVYKMAILGLIEKGDKIKIHN